MRSSLTIHDMGKPTIREVEVRDADSIAGLSCELGYPTDPDAMSTRLHDLLDSQDHTAFVTQDGEGCILGWIHVLLSTSLVSPPFAQIGGLVVRRDSRGRGLGRALVETAEDWARRHGLSEIRVRSNVVRDAAHRLYRQLGYENTKTQVNFRKSLNSRSS